MKKMIRVLLLMAFGTSLAAQNPADSTQIPVVNNSQLYLFTESMIDDESDQGQNTA